MSAGCPRKARDFPGDRNGIETRLQCIGNRTAQGTNRPNTGLSSRYRVVKHGASNGGLHLDAFLGYSLKWVNLLFATAPWKALCFGLSALISLNFFLLQLSSKCQDTVLAWFTGHVNRTFAQSYPQKLWGKQHCV
jgi:hypothetical protein